MRSKISSELASQIYDVAIVGGGINGAVAAAALSSAGLKVALLEKKDFAGSTSQESSNLVWGGIKYLESYEFGLVWELCRSRNELMKKYPSSVREIRFFTTIQKGFRKPRFLVFLGAILYWFMGRFQTQPPKLLSRSAINREEPIVETDRTQGGFEYSDCYLRDNDARFVFGFIRRAMRSGTQALNYAEVVKAQKSGELWQLDVKDQEAGIFTDPEAYDRILREAVPPELQDIAVLFDDSLLDSWYPDVVEHLAIMQIMQPFQIFAQFYPEFDHYWQLEVDSRFLGHTGNMLDKLSDFARNEPRKQARERASWAYMADYHGSYDDFFNAIDNVLDGDSSVWGPID
ncbi:MAG: FAD-dependent oxidoreductase, partial [Proteobacteria bacterium]